MKQTMEKVVEKLAENCHEEELFATKEGLCLPNRQIIIDLLKNFRRVLFPGYYGNELINHAKPEYFLGYMLTKLAEDLQEQIETALYYQYCSRKGHMPDRYGADDLCPDCSEARLRIASKAEGICQRFFEKVPKMRELLLKDVQAGFNGDPAAKSKEEIIFSYPGFFAITVYRIAHELYVEEVPFIPRIMTEYAHGKTGIDINSGAVIGEYFFIDHGTGVVIGETTTIGKHVKIYQGVTLGALSTRSGQLLSGVKRHPTIEDNVTIYANSTILGGETVVGANTVVGGNAFITRSVAPDTKIKSNTPL